MLFLKNQGEIVDCQHPVHVDWSVKELRYADMQPLLIYAMIKYSTSETSCQATKVI